VTLDFDYVVSHTHLGARRRWLRAERAASEFHFNGAMRGNACTKIGSSGNLDCVKTDLPHSFES
jgi:hypothetical protein